MSGLPSTIHKKTLQRFAAASQRKPAIVPFPKLLSMRLIARCLGIRLIDLVLIGEIVLMVEARTTMVHLIGHRLM